MSMIGPSLYMSVASLTLQTGPAELAVSPKTLSSRGGIAVVSLGGFPTQSPPIIQAPDGSKHQMIWREDRWQAKTLVPEAQAKASGREGQDLVFRWGTQSAVIHQTLRGAPFRGMGLTLKTYRSKPDGDHPSRGMAHSWLVQGLAWPTGDHRGPSMDWRGHWGVWTGKLVAEHEGPHQIQLEAAHVQHLKVTLNRGPVTLREGAFSIHLREGESASIRVEAFLDERSKLSSFWQPPLGPREPLPSSRLEPEIRRASRPSDWTLPADFPVHADWRGGPAIIPAPQGGEGPLWLRVQQDDGTWLVTEAEAGMANLLIPPHSSRDGRLFATSWLTLSEGKARLLPGPDIIQAPAPPAFAHPMPDAGLDPDYLDWEKALSQGASEAALPPVSASGLRAIYEPLARAAARKEGLSEAVFVRMIEVESAWDPNAMSPVGAMGLGQLMPDTAFELGVQDPFDPIQNLAGAAKYLARQHKRFGSYLLALAAYNAGPGAVLRHGGVPPYRETRRYVRKILGSGWVSRFVASRITEP